MKKTEILHHQVPESTVLAFPVSLLVNNWPKSVLEKGNAVTAMRANVGPDKVIIYYLRRPEILRIIRWVCVFSLYLNNLFPFPSCILDYSRRLPNGRGQIATRLEHQSPDLARALWERITNLLGPP